MNLTTTEKFLLLIQHPEKSRFIVSDQVKYSGFIGSVLLDLAAENNIELGGGKLIVKSKKTDLSETHKMFLEYLSESSKSRSIKRWINKLFRKSKKHQKQTLIGLENKGVIKLKNKSFLGIKYYKTTLINKKIRQGLINDLRELVFNDKPVGQEASMVLGLVDACKLHKTICYNKAETKECKKKLKEIRKTNLISDSVDKVIKEMQAAVVGAIVASSVAGAASSN